MNTTESNIKILRPSTGSTMTIRLTNYVSLATAIFLARNWYPGWVVAAIAYKSEFPSLSDCAE